MKSYFRFLSRNKLYTLINVVGLVVSLMFIILLGDYTWRQYSIDSWHKNADRIYLMGDQTSFSMWPQAGDRIKDISQNGWLSNFSYRIALSAWIFVAAGFTCFIISLLTVVFQSWRAASENPVNNIKTE